MKEPEIIINGVKMPESAASTIRVAIQALATDLKKDGLGEDQLGKSITRGYLDNIRLINEVMAKRT